MGHDSGVVERGGVYRIIRGLGDVSDLDGANHDVVRHWVIEDAK